MSCLTWVVVLAGLWIWGREITDGPPIGSPATGDVAAAGRPAAAPLPAAHEPMRSARPQRVEIDALGVGAPVVERGLDADGGIDPPPFDTPGVVGWFGGGPAPGASGTALLVGHVDTESAPAVFFRLGQIKPGERVRVVREDRSVAEFTVETVEALTKKRFDPARAYGPRQPDRAELRLITCGGSYDPRHHTYTANVVVSAYLTGTRAAPLIAGDRV
ncbi:class F sortase [Streptomyces sp. 8N706]|uniref:class F sortase n=1 Tax=Streptomyces sp. 8N706 TaxID=3457416 RepID=UPI003FD0FB52